MARRRTRSKAAKKSGGWKIFLWIIGWVGIFPLPLSILLSRKKEMNIVSKVSIIILAWLLYFFVMIMFAPTGEGIQKDPTVTTGETTAAIEQIEEETEQGDHYATWKNGRGRSDGARAEPNYINVIGYVSVYADQYYTIKKAEDFWNEDLWVVPTYEKDKQFWNEVGTLPHKTEVVVRKQILKHEGYGSYHGYLLVERTDDGSQYYIDVVNFITKPYWTYQDNLREAAQTGYLVAEYNQVSDYYPTDGGRNPEKVEIPDGTLVLITGINGGTTGTPIKAVVWKEWRYGYGGVDCDFNEKDLTILY